MKNEVVFSNFKFVRQVKDVLHNFLSHFSILVQKMRSSNCKGEEGGESLLFRKHVIKT
jgi:hypothetical protein